MFKIGDKVRRKKEFLYYGYWNGSTDVFTVRWTRPDAQSLLLKGLAEHYDNHTFELVKAAEDIDTTLKYETLAGEPVRVLAVDIKNTDFPIIVAVDKGGYEATVKLRAGGVDENFDQFIRKVNPYKNFKVNDKVPASDNGSSWVKRHFAGLSDDDKPQTFSFGKTQFTTDGSKNTWRECKLYNEEN